MQTGKLIYWESSIFLGWIKNEPRDPGVMEGVEETVREIEEHKASLLTSTITLIEVLDPDGIPGDARIQFVKLFERPNVHTIAADIRVARLAGDIRRHYRSLGKKLSVPDAIHLASAITLSVTEFHTFDKDFLPLSGNVVSGQDVVHKLQICLPYSSQLSLQAKLATPQGDRKEIPQKAESPERRS